MPHEFFDRIFAEDSRARASKKSGIRRCAFARIRNRGELGDLQPDHGVSLQPAVGRRSVVSTDSSPSQNEMIPMSTSQRNRAIASAWRNVCGVTSCQRVMEKPAGLF